jgi:hypothetical protein
MQTQLKSRLDRAATSPATYTFYPALASQAMYVRLILKKNI